jgi:hypothetical protein
LDSYKKIGLKLSRSIKMWYFADLEKHKNVVFFIASEKSKRMWFLSIAKKTHKKMVFLQL